MMNQELLPDMIRHFAYYKSLGEKTIARVPDERLFWRYNEESNSIGHIIKHLHGNMLSRWTDFLLTDGEKDWRDRDAEFDDRLISKSELTHHWEEGWKVLFDALQAIKEEDLSKTIYIRNEGQSVMNAMLRQLAHYAYHVGQIVYIGKMLVENWQSLSIPKNGSKQFNQQKFSSSEH